MQSLTTFLVTHSSFAPWMIFLAALLAGLYLPISIDLLLVVAAYLAASILPTKTAALFLSVTFGCICSAWIAYWVGRKVGKRLLTIPLLAKFLPQKRLEKLQGFYKKHGVWTVFVARFIPFGVRNCVYFTAGVSKLSFGKFILCDFTACWVWSGIFFFSFYALSQNLDVLFAHLKKVNISIFATFGTIILSVACYKIIKRRKKTR